MVRWGTTTGGMAMTGKRHIAGGARSPVTASLLLALCGFMHFAVCSTAQAADPSAIVPAKIRQAGTLTVAANPTYPPFAFRDDSGQAAGIEPDLVRAMAGKLGLTPVFTPIEFVTILPSIQAGRFDVGVGGFFDTPERRGVVRFVDYLYAKDGVVTRKGNPDHISVGDLCGKTISASESSEEATNLDALSKACIGQGKPAINVVRLKGTPAQIIAVKSGRVAGASVTKAVVAYMATQSGAGVEDVPGTLPIANGNQELEGILVGEDQSDLAKALQAAMNALIADGSYARILKKWGIPMDLALGQATLD